MGVGEGWQLLKIRGIPLRIHPSWFVILALATAAFQQHYSLSLKDPVSATVLWGLGLATAVAATPAVTGVFVLDPAILGAADMAPARVWFLLESLRELQQRWRLGTGRAQAELRPRHPAAVAGFPAEQRQQFAQLRHHRRAGRLFEFQMSAIGKRALQPVLGRVERRCPIAEGPVAAHACRSRLVGGR